MPDGSDSAPAPAACPFSRQSMNIVQATVPLLETGGETLTRAFYKKMFSNDPEVKAFFNPVHQVSGDQPRALADSVLAYASNLHNLGALGGAIELIAQKHVALNIKAEQYPIVGKNLLGAMVDVLGPETANKEVIDAWAEAYGFLADVLIAREKAIYDEIAAMEGGWNGKRKFKVVDKFRKSEHICSIVMKPEDGGKLMDHKPGQYLTIYPNETMDASIPRPIAPRNYTISNAPGAGEFRITVKRETVEGKPAGIFSNWIHDQVNIGDVVELGPAVGNFTLDEEAIKKRPAIFLGAGVGLTPFVSMVKVANQIAPEQQIYWFYSTSDGAHHPLIEGEIEDLARANKNIRTIVSYDYADAGEQPDFLGRYTPKGIVHLAGLEGRTDFDVYVCGPPVFMRKMVQGFTDFGVPSDQIHFEYFGPLKSAKSVDAAVGAKCPVAH